MSALCCQLILCLPLLSADAPSSPASAIGQKLTDCELGDDGGAPQRLSDFRDKPILVLVFLGTECPLAGLYAQRLAELDQQFAQRGVQIIGIDSNQQDSAAEIVAFARDHALRFPLFQDRNNQFADHLSAQRTPEVFLLDQERIIRYHGRIDDQFAVGVRRPQPKRRDLALAIEDVLAGREVHVPHTEGVGCFIGRAAKTEPSRAGSDAPQVTFTRDIAPLLNRRCVSCHREGSIGPFALMTYQDAAAWALTIQEVITQGRMPPWLASPDHGKFANEARLTPAEKQLIADWIAHGTPQGDPADLPPTPFFNDSWHIGPPDLVLSMPTQFEIPAHGLVDYQYFEVDPGFTEDKWIQAAELRPGNRAVVHHSLIFLRPPRSKDLIAQGDLKSVYLTGFAAGSPPLTLPSGMAKKIPTGWKLVFQMHYTTVGTPQHDQSTLGLIFADPHTVQKEVATNMLMDMAMSLPPHSADTLVEARTTLKHDLLLLSLSPHMHLRGKSFRYEAHYPEGQTEILLDIPRYDFGWQDHYVLCEPKRLPRGAVLHCTAHFDNSAANPANPDPSATVQWGEQTTDEMMIGYYDVALADQDLTRSPQRPPQDSSQWLARDWKSVRLVSPLTLYTFFVVGVWLVLRRHQAQAACRHS
jgi:peroxiredoxin